jgi:hypothetical protein
LPHGDWNAFGIVQDWSGFKDKKVGFFIDSDYHFIIILLQLYYRRNAYAYREPYTPSGDYVVDKFARWAFEKFREAADRITNICERVVFVVTGKMEKIGASKY